MASLALTGHGVSSSSDKAKVANPEASSDLISMSRSYIGETPTTRKQLTIRLVLCLPLRKYKDSTLSAEDAF